MEDIKFEVYKCNLPDNLFIKDNDKSLVSIILYLDEEKNEFLFFVNKGENRVYVVLDCFYNSVYQIIIYSKTKHIISQLHKKFYKFGSLGNK